MELNRIKRQILPLSDPIIITAHRNFCDAVFIFNNLLICCNHTAGNYNSSLMPSGDVYTCQGDVQVFTCLQFMQHARIEWLIHFERSLSESDVVQSYVPTDPVGEIQTDHRDGFMFIFNLTSSSSLGLASTLTVVVDTSSRRLINFVIVSCFQGNSAVLHIHSSKQSYEG